MTKPVEPRFVQTGRATTPEELQLWRRRMGRTEGSGAGDFRRSQRGWTGIPEIETLPHQAALNRVLCEIEQAHRELLDRMIRQKKSRRHLIGGHYPIRIDDRGNLVSGRGLER